MGPQPLNALSLFDPIIRLYQRGYKLKGILDIGAHRGMFTGNLKNVWPEANAMLFEANPRMQERLASLPFEYKICLLGGDERMVEYFVDRNNPESTGNSIYLETTEHFVDPICIQLPMHRLDSLVADPSRFDFMKLDVQGAELDVLRGGEKTLSWMKYVFVEVSLQEYNKGAPLFLDIYKYLDGRGFCLIDMSEFVMRDNKIMQFNAFFERRG